ncbi:unnamed protein product [Onchocerca ochengi]|uniref:C3H1-type domain-containing protein n=1 Tax=Onchocerca ochengi TaxID=42157 RepID=A0A182E9Y4_ONCOC|nr:unnamed protein product [Onchocerca ochengi]
MAYLYGNYTVTSSTIQQSPQLGLVVQCPNCCSRFCAPFPDHFNNSHSTFIYPQQWPQNVTYSHGSNFQYMQPFIQYPNSQNGMQSIFHPSTLPNCYLPAINQQHQEMIGDINSRQNVSQYAVDMDDIIHRIRDIIIDILNSAICKYGVTIPQLMILLKQSCANYNILLPSSIINNFKEFLHCKMTDYVEIQDDLCRCYIPTLSIQEESISSSSTCGSAANRSKTPPAALMSEITPAIAANASSSTNQMEKVILEKEDVKEKILYRNTEKPSFSPTKVQDNKNEQFCDVTKRQHRNGDVNKMILADRVILDDERESNGLHRHIENNAVIEHSFTKNDLTKIMKEWKEIFVGDIKELIRYLRMVDDYFQGSDGGFTLSKFKEVFGELNKRWEFCDIDLVEMGIINIMHNFDLDDEPVLIVNPIIREMKFPEMIKLATEIYNLLSKLLKSMHSVKVDVVVRTVNFGINDRKTIDEKYVLLWEVLSDSQFQDVFIIDVLQKQNEGKLK